MAKKKPAKKKSSKKKQAKPSPSPTPKPSPKPEKKRKPLAIYDPLPRTKLTPEQKAIFAEVDREARNYRIAKRHKLDTPSDDPESNIAHKSVPILTDFAVGRRKRREAGKKRRKRPS